MALRVDTSELRDHLSYGTCHPTHGNAPRLTPARKAGTRLTYPGGMEGWVDLGGWLYTETVTHPSINRARSRVTWSRPWRHICHSSKQRIRS